MNILKLSEKGRRVAGILKSGIAKGYSNNRIYLALKDESPWSYRKQTVLNDLKVLRGVEKKFKSLRTIGKSKRLGMGSYATTAKQMTSRYKTVVRLEGAFIDDKEPITRWMTVSHNDRYTIAQLEAKAIQGLEEQEYEIKWDKQYAVEAYFDPSFTGRNPNIVERIY